MLHDALDLLKQLVVQAPIAVLKVSIPRRRINQSFANREVTTGDTCKVFGVYVLVHILLRVY